MTMLLLKVCFPATRLSYSKAVLSQMRKRQGLKVSITSKVITTVFAGIQVWVI